MRKWLFGFAISAALAITAWSEVVLAKAERVTHLLLFWEASEFVEGPLNFVESCYWNGPEDSVYIVPRVDDLERMFRYIAKYWWSEKYVPNARDCDDAAREATYLAKRWSADFYDEIPASVAFGSAYVKLDGVLDGLWNTREIVTGFHVLNFYLDSECNVWFFEPQSARSARAESFIYEGSITVLKLEY